MIDTPSANAARRWFMLVIVLLAQFMFTLDSFIVNVAIPAVREDLHASAGQVQLIIALYQLAAAVLLITGGRLGDFAGRKRVFVIGLAGFTLASASCGLAATPALLIAGRVVQGLSAALMIPQVLAIIQVLFTGKERATAISLFGITLGLAAVSGQVLGGTLIQGNLFGLGWRPIFLVNLPVGIGALLAAVAVLPESRAPNVRRLDLGGVGILSVGLLLLIYPLVVGRDHGWPRWAFVCMALALPVLALFAWFEQWTTARGGTPLVALGLFRDRGFVAGLLVVLVLFGSLSPLFLMQTLYLQSGRHFTPLVAGLTYIPLPLAYTVASMLAPRLAARIGREILSLGAVIMVAGTLLIIATIHHAPTTLHGYTLAPAIAVNGFGQGFLIAPLFTTILARTRSDDAGAASGILLTMQQFALALGIAVIGIPFFGTLGTRTDGHAYADAYIHGLWALVALLAVTLLLIFLLPSERVSPPQEATARTQEPAEAISGSG